MSGVDLERLTARFPREAVKQRRGGSGRPLDYVEGHSVIHRLNDATGNRWSMEVKDISSRDIAGTDGNGRPITTTLMIARVALTLPDLGTREGLGVQLVHERGGEDLVKGCVTDALKKAATLFGVGLELYGPDYEEDIPSPTEDAKTGADRSSRQEMEKVMRGAPATSMEAGPDRSPLVTQQHISALHGAGAKHRPLLDHEAITAQAWARFKVGTLKELSQRQHAKLMGFIETGDLIKIDSDGFVPTEEHIHARATG